MKSLFQNLLLMCLSLMSAFVLAELALRFYFVPRQVVSAQVLRSFGVSEAEQNWARDTELGWIIRPNVAFRHLHPLGDFDQKVRTGDYGFRVALEGDSDVRPGRKVLFLGDSVTAAYEVPYEETFTKKVAAALDVVPVNAGVRGYSTEQSYKRMLRLMPQLTGVTDIVYLYSLNDPFENMSVHFPKRLFAKPGAYVDGKGAVAWKYSEESYGILDSEAAFVAPDGRIEKLPVIGFTASRRVLAQRLAFGAAETMLDHSYLYALTKFVAGKYLVPEKDAAAVAARFPYLRTSYIADSDGGYMPGDIDVSWEPGSYPLRLLEAAIVMIRDAAEAQGARFWLAMPVTVPLSQSRYFNAMATHHAIRLIDPISMGLQARWLERCEGIFIFKNDGHLNRCGHTAQADAIAKMLAPAH